MYGDLPEVKTEDGSAIHGYPVVIHNPSKTAVLRLPVAEEMVEYLSQQRTLYRDLGRRKGQSESIPNPKADQALFEKLRMDKAEPFDAHEAAHALAMLTQQRITGCIREGDAYRITLLTAFGETVHFIKIPLMKDLMEYRRSVYKAIDLPHGVEERRYPPDAPIKLYDSAVISASGYAQGTEVPPHHKQSVVFELVNAVNDLDPSLDPNS